MLRFLVWLVRSIFFPAKQAAISRLRRRPMDVGHYLRKAARWDATARSFDLAGFRHLARRSRAIAELYRRRAVSAARPDRFRAA